jgi:hypothetical protein
VTVELRNALKFPRGKETLLVAYSQNASCWESLCNRDNQLLSRGGFPHEVPLEVWKPVLFALMSPSRSLSVLGLVSSIRLMGNPSLKFVGRRVCNATIARGFAFRNGVHPPFLGEQDATKLAQAPPLKPVASR